jgi:hypothetical protein
MSRAAAREGGAHVTARGGAGACVVAAGLIDGCTLPLARDGAGPIGREACDGSPQQHGPISADGAQP